MTGQCRGWAKVIRGSGCNFRVSCLRWLATRLKVLMYHNARKISPELEHNKIERPPHPTYSPDINPCNFWPFGFLKEKLTEQELSTSDEITEAITTIWNDVTFKELQSGFSEWIQQVTLAFEHGGSITINDCYSFVKDFSLVEKARRVSTFWTAYIELMFAIFIRINFVEPGRSVTRVTLQSFILILVRDFMAWGFWMTHF
jgi:hypothetical protein